jgi:acetolactate synthase-1/2/3 large subunit
VRELYFSGQRPPKTLSDRALRWYLERHLARVFAPAAARASSASAPPAGGPVPDVRHIATRLASAQRPVLVVGSQALGPGCEPVALAAAIDALGVPVFLSGMARGLLGASHPLQFRHQRKQALREADVVLLAGTPCDFRLDYGRQIGRRTALVSINRDAGDLKKNRRPDIGVLAPPDQVLQALAAQAPSSADRQGWLDTLRGRERERDEDIAARAAQPVSPLNPVALCQAIDAHLSPDSIVVADGGDFVATASYIVRPRAPRSWLDPGVFGTLGVGSGFILGAHAARPGAPVWALFGDGALGFSLAEFDTLVRNRVPVVAVVGNDGKWAQIARDQVTMLGDDVATQLGRADYHRVVEGFGARGLLLDDPALVNATLAEARRIADAGVPVLVNALIGDTDFRKGSISL